MVKHIIFWKLKDEVKDEKLIEKVEILRGKFANLIGKIDGLLEAEVGLNYNGGNYDMCLYSVFESKEAEKAYQTHSLHLEIKEIVKTLICDRVCIDYEI